MKKTLRDPIDVEFGKGLRARRLACRLSLEELGRRIGVTYQQIQKYETGANRVAVSTAFRLAKAMSCRVEDLTSVILDDDATTRDRMSPSPADLRLAIRINGLSDENREKFEGLIDVVAEARAQRQPAAERHAH